MTEKFPDIRYPSHIYFLRKIEKIGWLESPLWLWISRLERRLPKVLGIPLSPALVAGQAIVRHGFLPEAVLNCVEGKSALQCVSLLIKY